MLTALELRERLAKDDPPTVIDVRESAELALAHIDGALHMPLAEFESAVRVLDRNASYVVLCHHGIRSAHAAELMAERGFPRVANLLGGIDAWSCEVDPSVPRY